MKKIILKFSLLIFPLALLVFSVNYYIDSGEVLADRGRVIAHVLAKGKNAMVFAVPKEWGKLHVGMIAEFTEKGEEPPDVVIFGTSRSSEASKNLFPGKKFFNHPVPGGSILDYIALYGLYKSEFRLPKKVIISLDPWTFRNRKDTLIGTKRMFVSDKILPLKVRRGMENYMDKGLEYIGEKPDTGFHPTSSVSGIDMLKEFFSPNYFQTNVKKIFRKPVKETTLDYDKEGFIIRSDGSYSLRMVEDVNRAEITMDSQQFVDMSKGGFFGASDTSSRYFMLFKKLVSQLQKDGVEVEFYISPVNPIVYNGLIKYEENAIEKAIHDLANSRNIKVIGGLDPSVYGLKLSDFIDEYHPGKAAVAKIFHSSR